jgi:hypothetical protein
LIFTLFGYVLCEERIAPFAWFFTLFGYVLCEERIAPFAW